MRELWAWGEPGALFPVGWVWAGLAAYWLMLALLLHVVAGRADKELDDGE